MRFKTRVHSVMSTATLCWSAILMATSSLAGAQVLEFERRLDDWVELAPTWQGAAFEEHFTPTATPPTGCLSGIGAVSMPLDGGWVTLETTNGSCPVVDGTSFQDVADAIMEEGETLRLTFDPPVRAFQSYYSSLAVGNHVEMRVIGSNGQVDHIMASRPSTDPVKATAHGFVSHVPIRTIEWNSTEPGVALLGRFGGGMVSSLEDTFEDHRNEPCGAWLCDFGYAYTVDYTGGLVFGTFAGEAIAVNQDWLAAGAWFVQPDGAVQLFGRSQGGADNWGLLKTLTPPVTSGGNDDIFGSSVALDGDTLVVGSPNFGGSQAGIGPGVVTIFRRDAGGPDNWASVQTLVVPEGFTRGFGGAVALQGDTMVIGAPYTEIIPVLSPEIGRAYVYQRPSGSQGQWTYIRTLVAPTPYPRARFGSSVAIDGSGIVVGSPWEARGHFSTSCATDLDNAVAGSAYVFRRDEGGLNMWGCTRRLHADWHLSTNSRFGSAVAIKGSMVVVGAPNDGTPESLSGNIIPFVSNQFVDSSPTDYDGWIPVPGTKFGSSVALNGDTLYVGAPGGGSGQPVAGAVHRFSLVVDPVHGLNTWTHSGSMQPVTSSAGDGFGLSVAMSDKAFAAAGSGFVYLQVPFFADGFESGDLSGWDSVP